MRSLRLPAMLLALAALAASCGGDEAIEVEDAWARTSPMVTRAGVVYMQLTSSDGDSLVSADVDSSIAAGVELHETVMADMESDVESDDMEGMGGAMTMRPVDAIALPPGDTVALEPGGLHIMLMELTEPLEAGKTFDLTLEFAESDERVVEIEVRDDAP